MTREEAEKIHEELSQDAEKYRQRLLDTELSLWTAILTLNGLIISAASVMVAMMEGYWRLGFLFSITFSLYSSVLIFRNFNRRRYMYRFLGAVPRVDIIQEDLKFEAYLQNGRKVAGYTEEHEGQNKTEENRSVACLVLSTGGLLFIVYFKFMFL